MKGYCSELLPWFKVGAVGEYGIEEVLQIWNEDLGTLFVDDVADAVWTWSFIATEFENYVHDFG